MDLKSDDAVLSSRNSRMDPPKLVRGVDTLRFFAALWVVFSHGGRFPVEAILDPSGGLAQSVIIGFSKIAFNGTAAVVVFFLVSGFCIHYPNADKTEFSWGTFLVRRLIRIGVPLVAIVLITITAGQKYFGALQAVLWSVYCEIIYYALYPVILWMSRAIGVSCILRASYIITFVMLCIFPSAIFLWEFGVEFTWLYCAPLWIAGVWLAEKFKSGMRFPLQMPISIWRTLAVVGGIGAKVFAYHLPFKVGYAWTMPFYAIFCVAWLSVEFDRWQRLGPTLLWEKLGAVSYSIYLVHMPVLTYFDANWAGSDRVILWGVKLCAVISLSGLFYILVEKPAHNSARRLTFRSRLSAA